MSRPRFRCSFPRLALLLSVLAFAAPILFAGCGTSTRSVHRSDDGRIVVTLWHSMGSPLSNSLDTMVKDFNASQNQYKVEAVYQGSYSDSVNKLISSIHSGNIPTVIQVDDVSTQIMIDSEEVTPIQNFIDAEHYDLSDFDPKVLSYYRVGGKLYSMPFNLAGPILYYDKQAFRDAGLDPEKPPATLEEVRQYSEKLLQRDASGNVTHYGIALAISPWIFEQMLAKQGALYVNDENGRAGRATQAVFNSEEGKKVLRWYKQMTADGLAVGFGTDSASAMLSVASGKAAMAMESTAALGGAVALIALSGQDPARLGTGPLPAPASNAQGGIVLGGASLWILGRTPTEEQRGAWEFMKFAASPEQQAQWHAATGYFPTRLSAYNLPPAIEREKNFPQFQTAVRQLRDSPDTPTTEGALLGPFKNVRDRITDAFQQALSGGGDPDQQLDAAAQAANGIIKDYNRTAP